MSITPKNWNTFQHYKDRSPAWIKLHRGLLHDFAFSRLPVASRALAPMLWLLASEYENGVITHDFEEVAFKLHMTKNEFCEALNPLIEAKFFVAASAPLARRKRGAIPEKRDIENIEKGEKEDIETNFEKLRAAYPKRKGGDPRKSALAAFTKLVKDGANPQDIIAGARDGVGFDRDKAHTEFIPQLVNWLKGERYRDRPPPVVVTATPGFYVVDPSPQMDAWLLHERDTGRSYPRDRNGGWHFPSEWPPGYNSEAA